MRSYRPLFKRFIIPATCASIAAVTMYCGQENPAVLGRADQPMTDGTPCSPTMQNSFESLGCMVYIEPPWTVHGIWETSRGSNWRQQFMRCPLWRTSSIFVDLYRDLQLNQDICRYTENYRGACHCMNFCLATGSSAALWDGVVGRPSFQPDAPGSDACLMDALVEKPCDQLGSNYTRGQPRIDIPWPDPAQLTNCQICTNNLNFPTGQGTCQCAPAELGESPNPDECKDGYWFYLQGSAKSSPGDSSSSLICNNQLVGIVNGYWGTENAACTYILNTGI